MDIPKEMVDLIKNRKNNEFSDKICSTCSAGCCKYPGFGIFENSIIIYDKYKREELKRKDYEYIKGLNYKEFITKYFNCFTNGVGLTFFYPKIFINNNELLSVPSYGDYLLNRKWILNDNKWIENYGCVFLEERITKNNKEKMIKCILHNDNYEQKISEKPIDCIFHTCNNQKQNIIPTQQETSLWFSYLNYFFPNSGNKFDNKND